jgi:glycosyltransferase involved in cell wall biosynthesis
MRVAIVGALPKSLLNFRGELLLKLVAAGHEVIALADEAPSDVVSRLKDMGVAFFPFPIQRNSMNPLADLKTYLALRKYFGELKPDVVMAYTIKPIIWGGLALRGRSGILFYALITGLGFAFQNDKGLRGYLTQLVVFLYRIALSQASGIIFQNSDNMEEFVSRKIVPKVKCSIVRGSGVNLSRFAHLPIIYKEECVFLAIGRLLKEKGFREFVQAAQLVKISFPDVVFQLVGPEDPSPDGIPLSEIQEWHNKGWIEYCGVIDDVRPFLNDCSVFVLPSYHEGMPRTVLEAMSVGRPILTTDVPGCRETVLPGKNGFLVPKGDVEKLAERMIWFIENRDQWEKMGTKSRKLAEENFDVHQVNKELMNIMKLEGYQEI